MTLSAIEFDFASHLDRKIEIGDATTSHARGNSVWVDIDLALVDEANEAFRLLSVNPSVVEAIAESPSAGRHDIYEDCLHLSLSIPIYQNHEIQFEVVELILGDRLLITLHRGQSFFLDRVRENYPTFFRKFALSLGFLLFEVWDLLIERYRQTLASLEEDVELAQKSIFEDASDEIFQRVSHLTSSVLEIRKASLAMRDSLDLLGTHKSAFIPTTAQPYLLNMVGSLDRLAGDLTIERETLAEVLTLYLGMVSHRTNQLLHRLTLVSIVFMPLTFLCGVYGMNFDLPEYSWKYGNVYFWSLIITCVTGMVFWMRLRKMW